MQWGLCLAGFLLSLAGAEAFVRVSRWEVASPCTESQNRRSVLETLPITLLMLILSLVALALAGIPFARLKPDLAPLLPAVALGGWCCCWARGLERYIDRCYPSRTLSTMNLQGAVLTPFGVILLGLSQLHPFKSPTDSLLAAAFLLPAYFTFSVLLARRAFPAVRFERMVLQSMLLRFALGFILVGAISWTVWTYLPALRRLEIAQIFWWFLPYVFGTALELTLARRLSEKTIPVEKEVEQPAFTNHATVEITEDAPRISVGR